MADSWWNVRPNGKRGQRVAQTSLPWSHCKITFRAFMMIGLRGDAKQHTPKEAWKTVSVCAFMWAWERENAKLPSHQWLLQVLSDAHQKQRRQKNFTNTKKWLLIVDSILCYRSLFSLSLSLSLFLSFFLSYLSL